MASSTASEIWSAILSGCPSVTDSEVNRYSSRAIVLPPQVVNEVRGGLTTHSGQPSMAPYRAQAKWAFTIHAESYTRNARVTTSTEDDGLDVSCGLVVVDAEEEADALTHDRCPDAAPRATGPCARGRAGAAPPASPSDGGPRCSLGPR